MRRHDPCGADANAVGRRRRGDRVAARPAPPQWRDDELMTLDEAIRLYWPDGLLSVKSLRTEVKSGKLAVARIAGKLFTSPAAVKRMTVCVPRAATLAPSRGGRTRSRKLAEARAYLARRAEGMDTN